MAAGELAGVQRDREDLAPGDARLDALADQARVRRAVAGVEAQMRIRRDPEHPATVGVRPGLPAALPSPGVPRAAGRPGDNAASCDGGTFARSVNHVSSCSWKSRSFANARPGSKLRSMKSCRRSTTPLACGSAGAQNCQSTLQLPAERGELLARAAAVAVDAGLAVPDQRLGQRAQGPQTARDPRQQVRRLFREDQRAGASPSVAPGTRRRPTPRRVWPCPTGTSALGSQRSN